MVEQAGRVTKFCAICIDGTDGRQGRWRMTATVRIVVAGVPAPKGSFS